MAGAGIPGGAVPNRLPEGAVVAPIFVPVPIPVTLPHPPNKPGVDAEAAGVGAPKLNPVTPEARVGAEVLPVPVAPNVKAPAGAGATDVVVAE